MSNDVYVVILWVLPVITACMFLLLFLQESLCGIAQLVMARCDTNWYQFGIR
jgi:hypothetical protein